MKYYRQPECHVGLRLSLSAMLAKWFLVSGFLSKQEEWKSNSIQILKHSKGWVSLTNKPIRSVPLPAKSEAKAGFEDLRVYRAGSRNGNGGHPCPASSELLNFAVAMKKNKGKQKSSVLSPKEKTRNFFDTNKEEPGGGGGGSSKRPKRAAACKDFQEKSIRLREEKSSVVESKKEQLANEEILALCLTQGQEDGRPNRRLIDFVAHDANGTPQALEMIEVDNMFISGIILPLEESLDKEKEMSVRCEGFGRIETWDISGYEDGSPFIWLSTEIADYDCIKPASGYKKFFDHFFQKALVCIEVYKKLSRLSGGTLISPLMSCLRGLCGL
ncbi:unnamed protein product [Dovyalis caffra]|uniref:RFTS domain-containing protein n=1 Tax=Dovyalis caffra TaxID=77055 RepID=A0AAV1R5F8_9ROSI|nr:unnamed protein product [Dovyalis caffra]